MVDVQLPYGYATHGAEDLGIYASGPMAHLFHGVHEESYVAHMMKYAGCLGENKVSLQSEIRKNHSKIKNRKSFQNLKKKMRPGMPRFKFRESNVSTVSL